MAWYQSPRGHRLRQKSIKDYFKSLEPRDNQRPRQYGALSSPPHLAPSTTSNAQHLPPSRIGILDLPRNVFRMIMHHLNADLTRDCAFLLNKRPSEDFFDDDGRLDEDLKQEWHGLPSDISEDCRFTMWEEMCPNDTLDQFSCECREICWRFHELITCCRAFWLELSPMVFASNSFVVHRCAHGGMLGPLKAIGSANLAALTSLKIVVNSALPTHPSQFREFLWLSKKREQEYCSCYCNDPVPKDDSYPYEFCHCEGVDRPFSRVATGRGRRALLELEKVVHLLKAVVQPGQLELGIVCDCKELATAEAFVSVLYGLPRLCNCALRLSLGNNALIRELALPTVAKVTGNGPPVHLSGFARLPRELRARILELTDLVAPTDIDFTPWWPHGGFQLQFRRQRKVHICEPVSGWNMPSISYAKSCACWTFPLSLFLVNREFNQEATRIFFSQNHFIILPWRERFLPYEDEDVHIPSYLYLPRLSASVLPWLRSVQIIVPLDDTFLSANNHDESRYPVDDDGFPVYDQDYIMDTVMFWEYPDEYNAWRDRLLPRRPIRRSKVEYWSNRIIKALRGIPLNKLELTLDFRSLAETARLQRLTSERITMWGAMFQRVVDIAAAVNEYGTGGKGFSNFFVHTPQGMGEEYAQWAEKMAMGEDYNSGTEGKFLFPNRFMYWFDYLRGEGKHLVTS